MRELPAGTPRLTTGVVDGDLQSLHPGAREPRHGRDPAAPLGLGQDLTESLTFLKQRRWLTARSKPGCDVLGMDPGRGARDRPGEHLGRGRPPGLGCSASAPRAASPDDLHGAFGGLSRAGLPRRRRPDSTRGTIAPDRAGLPQRGDRPRRIGPGTERGSDPDLRRLRPRSP